MPRNYFLKTLNEVTTRTRGYIPHWELPGATYSVTFRLDGSLPREVVARLHEERKAVERAITGGVRSLTGIEDMNLRAHMETRYDNALHANTSVAHLSNPDVADLVARTLRFFDNERYRLDAWAIMPNHVHTVLMPFQPHDLATIFHSWKSYSSNRANAILGRQGTFWHREYYDRIVRDERDLADTIEYVLRNPEKAGLKNWPWTSAGWKPA
ncbi:MAG TPA: transposase [Thermoanaerobaculia bacterium]|jgi:REP element-mobilizing transposase RayT|nr:transposase [Thermoanaerobaculia bacterium]